MVRRSMTLFAVLVLGGVLATACRSDSDEGDKAAITIEGLVLAVDASTVELTARVAIENGELRSIVVDWGDGNRQELAVVSGDEEIVATHAYADDGTYTVKIEAASDTGSAAFDAVAAVIERSPAPTETPTETATATPTETPTPTPTETPAPNQAPTIAGLAFSSESLLGTLTASVTDDDGEVATVDIDWGDGRSSHRTGDFANIFATHRYGDPGEYTVRLVAVDDRAGSVAESRDVRVVRVRVDQFLLSSVNVCDNFSSGNEFSGSVTATLATSTLINFSVNTLPVTNLPLSNLTFSEDVLVTTPGGGGFSVSGRLIEIDGGLEGGDDNLGSFSRSFSADIAASSAQSFSQNLNGDGCSAIIRYTVSMDVR